MALEYDFKSTIIMVKAQQEKMITRVLRATAQMCNKEQFNSFG
jgi:hypothetical protein